MNRVLSLFRYSHQTASEYFPLVHDKQVSEGYKINDEVCKFLESNNIRLSQSNEAYSIGSKGILIPDSKCFSSETNFHHAILHEVAHCLTYDLLNRSSRDIAEVDYALKNGEFPNVNNMLAEAGKDPEKINSLDPLSKKICCEYLKEEVAVELAAFNMLEKVGLQPDKMDLAYSSWNISNSMAILEKSGERVNKFEIMENAGKLLDHFERSIDMIRHYEQGKSDLPHDKMNDKDSGKDSGYEKD